MNTFRDLCEAESISHLTSMVRMVKCAATHKLKPVCYRSIALHSFVIIYWLTFVEPQDTSLTLLGRKLLKLV
jgi:hypothetical protein